MLGNTLFISRVEHHISDTDIMFNTRNKYGISTQPCIILYLKHTCMNIAIIVVTHEFSAYM